MPVARTSTLPTGFPRFGDSPLVGRAFLMSHSTAFAGDLALLLGIHRGKTAVASALTF